MNKVIKRNMRITNMLKSSNVFVFLYVARVVDMSRPYTAVHSNSRRAGIPDLYDFARRRL